mmetsp:Transcript_37329/g.88229  ORF Transcript_37329/g.88229 Transcript_37329/m.88229 type:complete len:227 (+) Transcript_37329:59-739(+)
MPTLSSQERSDELLQAVLHLLVRHRRRLLHHLRPLLLPPRRQPRQQALRQRVLRPVHLPLRPQQRRVVCAHGVGHTGQRRDLFELPDERVRTDGGQVRFLHSESVLRRQKRLLLLTPLLRHLLDVFRPQEVGAGGAVLAVLAVLERLLFRVERSRHKGRVLLCETELSKLVHGLCLPCDLRLFLLLLLGLLPLLTLVMSSRAGTPAWAVVLEAVGVVGLRSSFRQL